MCSRAYESLLPNLSPGTYKPWIVDPGGGIRALVVGWRRKDLFTSPYSLPHPAQRR